MEPSIHLDSPGSTAAAVLPNTAGSQRLVDDVRTVLRVVGERVADRLADFYPVNEARAGALPWCYLWAVTIPCDGCGRRFSLVGSLVLRHPNRRADDRGQAFRILTDGDTWRIQTHDGAPTQDPTFSAPDGKLGKSARCPFPTCGHRHNLDTIKAKGSAGQYIDTLVAVGEDRLDASSKAFRTPRADETLAAAAAESELRRRLETDTSFVPAEVVAPTSGVDARNYGYLTYGALMNPRQTLLFATTARVIKDMFVELSQTVSADYAAALCGYASANLAKQLRRATRGARRETQGRSDGSKGHSVLVGDIYANQSTIAHAFDYLETGPGAGPGTWSSVSTSLLGALQKVVADGTGARPARLRSGSAVALPFRDSTVDVIVCDPPYYTSRPRHRIRRRGRDDDQLRRIDGCRDRQHTRAGARSGPGARRTRLGDRRGPVGSDRRGVQRRQVPQRRGSGTTR
jgi:putative DNA methylase